jgi:hypothetical protein
MGKRIFKIGCRVEVEVVLDDQIIDVVDDEWRSQLYNLYTPEEIAEHIGLALLQGWTLKQLDGWADQPVTNARLRNDRWEIEYSQELIK